MPLQFRRDTTANITQFDPVLKQGEPLWDIDEKKLYIGDGENPATNLDSITGVTESEVGDVIAQIIDNGTSPNINFVYDSGDLALNVSLDFTTPLNSEIRSIAGFVGSLIGDDSVTVFESSESAFVNLQEAFLTDIGPRTDNAFDVGSATKRFKEGFFHNINVIDQTVVEDIVVNGLIKTEDSSVFFDSRTSTLAANTVKGDFYGSLFGDDSTLLVDAVNNAITGLIITNLISSADSSAIVCDTPFVFETNVNVQSALTVDDGGLFTSEDYLDFPLAITAAHEDDIQTNFTIRRSRGSLLAPTTLLNQDRIGGVQFNGHDGTTYVAAASIQTRVAGSVSTGIVPTEMRFFVTNILGNEIEATRIQAQGTTKHFSNSSTISPLVLQTAHNVNVGSNLLNLQRSRGTTFSPTASNTGDTLFGIAFQGYDGTSFITAATVRGAVDGTITTGAIPGKLEFVTANSSGTFAVNMVLNKDGVLEVNTLKGRTTPYVSFNQMPVLPTYADEAAATSAVTTPVNGMMYYDSGAGKIKGSQGGAWVILAP